MIRVDAAPSELSWDRTANATAARSPLSTRTAPSDSPATEMADRTAASTSKVSTRSVVPRPSDETWAENASFSESCTSVNACAEVPLDGTPYRYRAARLEEEPKPAMYAARAAATPAASCVRRDPISIKGRPLAACTIREAADATAQSWFRTESAIVSSRTASANVPSTTRIGDPGKYTSPSA